MSEIVKLDRWFVTADPWQAPGCRAQLVHGNAYGHPRFADGRRVVIGTVREIDGRIIKTKRTTYRLGRIDPEYRERLKRAGIPYDPKEPIKWVKR